MNHLLEVASLVAEATEGSDHDVIIAALLHDSVEDQEVPQELLAKEFGFFSGPSVHGRFDMPSEDGTTTKRAATSR